MRVSKNIIANLVIWLWPLVLAVASTRVLLHGLGPEAYGVLVLVNSVAALLGFASGGVGYAVVKHLSHDMAVRNHDSARAIVGTSLALSAGAAVFAFAALNLLSSVVVHHLLHVSGPLASAAYGVVFLTSLSLGIGFIGNIYYSALIALQRYSMLASVRVLTATLLAATQIVLVYLGKGIVSLAGAMLGCTVLGLLVVLVRGFSSESEVMWRPRVSREAFRKVLSFGAFRTLDMAAMLVLMQMDRVMVGSYLGASAVAYYAIPQNLAQQVSHMATSLTEPLFPRLSEMLAKGDRETVREMFRRSTRLLVWLVATGIACGVVLADLLFRWWLGAAFAQHAAPILRWLLLGWGLYGISLVSIFALNAFGLPQINAGLHLVQALALLGGAVILIPVFGGIGAAYALTAVTFLTVPAYLVYADRRLKIESVKVLSDLYLKPFLIGAAVLAAGIALRQAQLGVLCEAGLFLFLPLLSIALALAFGTISASERQMGWTLVGQAWSGVKSLATLRRVLEI